MNFRHIALLLVIGSLLFACKPEIKSDTRNLDTSNNSSKIPQTETPYTVKVSPSQSANYQLGETITFTLIPVGERKPDSVHIYLNRNFISKLSNSELSFLWDGTRGKTGSNKVEFEVFEHEKKLIVSKNIIIYPETKPENYTYRVKKVYKHDVNAYTQGLFYHGGFLYEATGLKGESTVRKVKFETGEVVQSFAIPTDIFGEGIVLFDDKIIQLSWDSGRGFVYSFNDFKLLDEFSYSGEGWGICTDGDKLYMSDGSPAIRILDPTTYSETDRLEIYDNQGPVKNLNELEYIDGEIYANIYQYEKIARIDPATGKVLAYIDLDGILPMNDWVETTDVLNGIAYDKTGKRLFVTGKRWPKLFEIELIKK